MRISRREFLKYCGISAAALGLSAADLAKLEEVLANPNAPTVLWLQGSACTGCSVSFLNRVSATAPKSAADTLINSINLAFHPNLMSLAGDSAVAEVEKAYNAGGYILVVEGGVPTALGGNTCWPWHYNGVDVTFQQAVNDLSSRAAAIVCVGTCASWGGVAAASPNPTGIKGVKAATGKTTINVAGCPPHPDWVAWAIVQLLMGNTVALDSNGRPTAIYSRTVHSMCPRRENDETKTFGVDNRCLKELGCRGPETRCDCPSIKWNNGVNWCIDANGLCIGCTEPSFPGTNAFYKEFEGGNEEDPDTGEDPPDEGNNPPDDGDDKDDRDRDDRDRDDKDDKEKSHGRDKGDRSRNKNRRSSEGRGNNRHR